MAFSDTQTKIASFADIKADMTIGCFFSQSLLDPVDLRMLLCHALKLTHAQLIVRSKERVSQKDLAKILKLLKRRMNGEPIAYIVGEKEFYGLPFRVTPDVLIPRPETELLVELALCHLPENGRFLDLGTGSGIIAVSVKHERKDVSVTATDISASALEVAKSNAKRHLEKQDNISFYQGDWFSALPDPAQFDVIAANPPYIEKGNRHLLQGDLRFEPIQALTDFDDGLSAFRDIVLKAPRWLKNGGRLFMEHGYNQADQVRNLLKAAGFSFIRSWRDLAGIERASGGVFMK